MRGETSFINVTRSWDAKMKNFYSGIDRSARYNRTASTLLIIAFHKHREERYI